MRFACAAALALALSTAFAAPIGVHPPVGTTAPATRSLAPAPATGTMVTPTPTTLRADLEVANNNVTIGGRLVSFGTTTGIISTAIVQPSGPQRGREREPSCSFNGSFTIVNAGGRQSDAVDVNTWFEQPQGPQVGEISSMGYGNPALAPGGTQPWSFGATLMQGSYVFHLVIDPKHLNKQYTAGVKLSCGYGGIAQMRAPSALTPAPAPAGIAPRPSGGIKLAQPRPKGIFMRIQGIEGESKDPAHPGWIELLSLSWGVHNEGSGANARGGAPCPGGGIATEITVTKNLDKSDPALETLANKGRATDIMLAEHGLTVQLRQAQITSLRVGEGRGLTEQLTLVGCR
jgi:Type VI secretion system effector, Hcp